MTIGTAIAGLRQGQQSHPRFFHAKKNAPRATSKCMMQLRILVGDASFELATPAV
jgi:hypothetical protein